MLIFNYLQKHFYKFYYFCFKMIQKNVTLVHTLYILMELEF